MSIKPAPIIAIHSPLVSVSVWYSDLTNVYRLSVGCGSTGIGYGPRSWT